MLSMLQLASVHVFNNIHFQGGRFVMDGAYG